MESVTDGPLRVFFAGPMNGGEMTTSELAEASNQSYNRTGDRSDELAGYKLDPTLSNRDHAVYVNPETREATIAFRGTDLSKNPKRALSDLKADFGILTGTFGGSRRLARAERKLDKVKSQYPDYSIQLTGHSLGGRTAIAVAKKSKGDESVAAFNPGSGPGELFKAPAPNDRVTVYRTALDPISLSVSNRYRTRVVPQKPGTSAHSLVNFL